MFHKIVILISCLLLAQSTLAASAPSAADPAMPTAAPDAASPEAQQAPPPQTSTPTQPASPAPNTSSSTTPKSLLSTQQLVARQALGGVGGALTGAASGALIGCGTFDLLSSPSSGDGFFIPPCLVGAVFGGSLGVTLGSASGVYLVGRYYGKHGGFVLTTLGGVVMSAVGAAIGNELQFLLGQDPVSGTATNLLVPSFFLAGAIGGYHLSGSLREASGAGLPSTAYRPVKLQLAPLVTREQRGILVAGTF